LKRVLVLGSGLVSGPMVKDLARHEDILLTVADADLGKAERAVLGHPRARAAAVSIEDASRVAALVGEADLVVSLLPFTLHPKVARIALDRRVPLITTSYVSPEMRALDGEARSAGVLLLNEIGLDPGLDHMSAMRMIRAARGEGRRLLSFRSCCGGLPAPEANTNPWGYKFSWSPRGVLAAGRNAARWLEDGVIVDVPGPELFRRAAPYDVPGIGKLEVYPNRDSTAYVSLYGVAGIQTMFRGTLRYPGWCETLDAASRLGLLDDTVRRFRAGTTYEGLMDALAAHGEGTTADRVAARLGLAADGEVMRRFAWAGLFSSASLPSDAAAPIDALCARLAASMAYAENERDMIVLQHELATADEAGRTALRKSTLIAYGEPGGDSAMSRTVSLPAAAAARLILDGKIRESGVRIPVDPEIFDPVLDLLAPAGIVFHESQTAP
jgi:saccharopine dehydrogenase (NADP+, L-glutamate forming)